MKNIIKNFNIFLIFFIVFLFKDSIYSLLIKTDNNIKEEIINAKTTYYEDEYNKLLRTLNILSKDEYTYTYSKVLYRDIYEYYNEITILKGTKDNINNNKAVINEFGLIGVITSVKDNSSVVTLITNKDSNISIKVNESYGILKSNNSDLFIESINNYENINIGDIVYTSGLGNLPANIKIGEVINIESDSLGIEKRIKVKPYVDFNEISYVAILNGEEV